MNKEKLLNEINSYRKNKLKECKDPVVIALADGHSSYMNKEKDFSHSGFEAREQAITFGTKYHYVGECLAIHYSSAKEAVRAWAESPGHKRTMTNNKYSEVAISIMEGYITAIFVGEAIKKENKPCTLFSIFVAVVVLSILLTILISNV